MGLAVSTSGVRGGRTPDRVRREGTEQQEEIWRAIVEDDCHVGVEARAGTGKSTVCAEAMHRLDEAGVRGLAYAAFNRHVADDFQQRIPQGAVAQTIHGLGFAMLKSSFGDCQIEHYKTDRLAERYFPGKWDQREERVAACKLVSLCKAHLLDGDDEAELLDLAFRHDIDLKKSRLDILGVVPELVRESKEQTAVVDYDDMLWLPVVHNLTPARPFSHLFIDEAQDLNAAQHELALRLCPEGRIIPVGDPYQAIYAFRGADQSSMETLSSYLMVSPRGIAKRPLTITWRCPKSHVDLARKIVPDLQAAPSAIEGEILELDEPEAIAALMPGDMALCRNNAPLVSACFRLIRGGTKAVVRGRDIGKGLLALTARMKARDLPTLASKLDDYKVEQMAVLSQLRNPEAAIAALFDRVDCLLALVEESRSVEDLKAKIESLFSDDTEANAVVFSTIHKAKGLERRSITILRPDLLPHPACKGLSAMRQELNLAYVAVTRSMERLTFAGPMPTPFLVK